VAAVFAFADFLDALSDFFEAFRDVLVLLRAVRLAMSSPQRSSFAAIVDRLREIVQPLVRAARANGGICALCGLACPDERAVQPSLSATYAATVSG
jgi:hypothetical protein